jgi:hypothetical protein
VSAGISTSIETRQEQQGKAHGGISEESTDAAAATVFPFFIQVRKRSKVQRSRMQRARKTRDGIQRKEI